MLSFAHSTSLTTLIQVLIPSRSVHQQTNSPRTHTQAIWSSFFFFLCLLAAWVSNLSATHCLAVCATMHGSSLEQWIWNNTWNNTQTQVGQPHIHIHRHTHSRYTSAWQFCGQLPPSLSVNFWWNQTLDYILILQPADTEVSLLYWFA